MRIAATILTVLGVLSGASSLHAAPNCDQFKTAIIEGAEHYQAPAQKSN